MFYFEYISYYIPKAFEFNSNHIHILVNRTFCVLLKRNVHRNPFTCYNTTEYTKVDGTGVHKTNTFLLDFKRIARSYLRILIEIELISCFMHTGAFRIKILLSHEFNYFVNFTLLYVHFFLYYSANFSIQDEETRSHLNLYHDNRKLLFIYKMKDGLKLKKKKKKI